MIDTKLLRADGVPVPVTNATIDETIKIAESTNLSRPTSPIDLDLARKLISGQRAFFFFGFNADVDAAWEDIHTQGGDIGWLWSGAAVLGASRASAPLGAG